MVTKVFNLDYVRVFAILIAVGFVPGIGWMFLDSFFRSKEFPDLTFTDSLDKERVLSFETNRGVSYVDFGDGLKYTLNWGQNRNYDDDHFSIVTTLSIGDLVTKKANSDTITIKQGDIDYVYVLGHLIEKSN